jgi:transposase
LQYLVGAGQAAAREILHAHVLSQADEGPDGPEWRDTQISEALSVHPNTVAGIRERFVEQGWEAALNRKKQDRPSRAPKLDGRAEARLLVERCGPPPQGHKRWTLQLLADRLVTLQVVDRISYETVRRTLKKTS